ncbi:MAG: UbiH/UbiF family hydroxylase [Burkholderiales bacterium]|nr:UbiH/UbiF family hydroxylase [Burkholderiales bacterium]
MSDCSKPEIRDVADVAIVGGGLVGASLALALQRAGLAVALIEPQRPQAAPAGEAWDSRIYAISPGNALFLESLGAWTRLDPRRVQRVETMAICGDTATGRLDFSAYDAGLAELAWIVEGGALQQALREAIAEVPDLQVLCPAQAASLQVDAAAAQITLADGRLLQAQLVVGTDGGDSWVRRAAGIATQVSDYPQLGVVANFEVEKPHGGTAFQWFRADGVLALLPLPGNRVSMVWSATADHAQLLLALDAQALADRVAEASGGAVGQLRLITPAAGFPLRLAQVANLVAPRVALAGDAAHTVHPLAGQGVNLGFRDVRELAAVLGARAPQQDCGDFSLLRRYERARREDIAVIGLSTDVLQKLFAARSVWLSGVRNFGMGAVNRLAFLKHLLIRHAAA